jgi:hypothetical protein
MQNTIELTPHVDVARNILLDESETRLLLQVSQVLAVARDEIVHPNNVMTVGEETVTKVGPEKAGGAGYENAH